MNIFFRSMCIIALSLLLTACLNFGEAPGDVRAPVELQSGVKNVIIYRRPAFFHDNKPIFLTLNKIDIAKIRINEYIEVGLAPGPHVLGARCGASERPLTREWRTVRHEITIKDTGILRYIELGPCEFKDETEADAERQMNGYTLRPLKDGISTRIKDWLEEHADD
jgi:hypothetical protein